MTTTLTITRFNTTTRPATDEADERDVLRFFAKRSLIGEIDLDDVTRYGEGEEFDAADFAEFLTEGDRKDRPRTVEQAIAYLTEEASEEGDDEEERESGSVVPEKYRVKYGTEQNCGDEIALALTDFVTEPRKSKKNEDGGLDRAKLRAVAEVNGIGDKLAIWEERGLNGGLLRMNTSNVLRGMNRRGERVEIGLQVWEARDVPKKVRKPRAKKATKKA